ncbi:FIST N-terminal domain-containing protein [Phenylobacterium sp. SCN 70-31]|uniref:FIST signal transduction protein n=1 Tax=Phenylobacterium sp. SCN 70-31 TaxID=1660129 RepID=UPI00086AFD17|nr:FIST N-terminal domain-containing protein [Phenylobacterium sp. SCN 70-31]ODT88731.1 MAG: hypothetical protein ABS78_06120 [Phenylobacterium sp. SCN 70-31]
MKIASAYSLQPDPRRAADEAAGRLRAALGDEPALVLVYATEELAVPALVEALTAVFPGAPLAGGTSCGGVMTEAGFHAGPGGAVGLLGVIDPEGDYGVGSASIGDDPLAAGAAAMERALCAAGRDFETPLLVWCCQPPGDEEAVIAGIESVVGRGCPIIGGSAADHEIAGRWREFAGAEVLEDHVVVAALFPSARHGVAFQSGYAPTGDAGVVTQASGRQILEIDGRPAAAVYSEWTGGAVGSTDHGMILAKSTPTPLGRVAGDSNGVPLYVLSHPAMLGLSGDLSLFTGIEGGDRVHLMRGSPESLVKRAGLVVNDACAMGGWAGAASLGGLVIYCGGCMLHVRDAMDQVVDEVRRAMPGAPFLGAFTFGEQGAIVDHCNRHGNLMVSALAFG